MSINISSLLERDEIPKELYALLGRPLFDPGLDTLLSDIRAASRELLPYQNHSDASIAKRTIQVQYALARAATTFADSAKLQDYHRELIHELRNRCPANVQLENDPNAARAWLQNQTHARQDIVDLLIPAIVEDDIERSITALDNSLARSSQAIDEAAKSDSASVPPSRQKKRRVFGRSSSPQATPAKPAWVLTDWLEELAKELPALKELCPTCRTPLPIGVRRCGVCGWYEGFAPEKAAQSARKPRQSTSPRPKKPVVSAAYQAAESAGYSVPGKDAALKRLPDAAVHLAGVAGALAGLAATIGVVGVTIDVPILIPLSLLLTGLTIMLTSIFATRLLTQRRVELIDVNGAWDGNLITGLLLGSRVDTNKGNFSCFGKNAARLQPGRCYWVATARVGGVRHVYEVLDEVAYSDIIQKGLKTH